jgi:hypothetical protein
MVVVLPLLLRTLAEVMMVVEIHRVLVFQLV